MKILHVIPYFEWSYGGSVRVVFELSKLLAKRGHDVTIYTTNVGRNGPITKNEEIEVDGVKVKYFNCMSNWMANNLKLHISPQMRIFIKDNIEHFDIIHLHELRGLPNVYAWLYAKKFSVPYVIQPDCSTPKVIPGQNYFLRCSKYLYDLLFGYNILRDSNKVIAISKEEREHDKKMGAQEDKISLIYTGIDTKPFEIESSINFKEKYEIDDRMILYLGRINRTKGIDFLIKAFSELSDECKADVILVIAGSDDGHKSYLEKLVDNLNIKDKVLFTGYVTDDERIAAYQSADLFVHTVKYMGGVGITPLEAILCNSPIIVTKECGEIVEEANCGLIVEYGDIDGLKEKIEYSIQKPTEMNKLIKNGKCYIQHNLTWDIVVKKVENVYNSLM